MLTELEFNNNRALKSRFNGYGDYVDQINEMDTTQYGNKFNFMDYLPFGDKSISGSIMKGIANLGGKSYQQFDPRGNTKGGVYTMDGVNYADPSQVNESYDNDRSSPTYGTNRFDRAKSGSFASYRTLKDFFDSKKDTAPKTTTTTAPTNNDNDNVNQDFSTTASVSNYDPSVLYADGGRAGYFFGGRVNYKIGGVVHPDGRKGFFKGAQADTSKGESMSPGTDASGGFRGGDNDGGASDNPPVTVVNNNPIDISTVTKSVGDYEIPYGVEALLANRGKFKAVINPDEILDKNLGAEFTYDNGPFSIGAYADMDGDKSLNANYTRNNSNYSFDLNDDGGQLKFTRTFANGGLAGLL